MRFRCAARPMPLHRRDRRNAGFNQAFELARADRALPRAASHHSAPQTVHTTHSNRGSRKQRKAYAQGRI